MRVGKVGKAEVMLWYHLREYRGRSPSFWFRGFVEWHSSVRTFDFESQRADINVDNSGLQFWSVNLADQQGRLYLTCSDRRYLGGSRSVTYLTLYESTTFSWRRELYAS